MNDDHAIQPIPPTPALVPAQHAPIYRCESCGYNLPAPANFCGHCGSDMFPEHSPLMADVIDRYVREILPTKAKSTAFTQRLQLDIWKRELGAVPIRKLRAPMIVEVREGLLNGFTYKGTIRSGATVARYLAVLRHLLRVASEEWELIDSNPCKKVSNPKESPGRIRFLSDEERRRLLDECRFSQSKTLHPLVVTAISTGARRGELMALHWRDMDLDRGVLTFHVTKNGEPRQVPVTGLALDMLRDLRQIQKEGDQIFKFDTRDSWREVLKRAKIENFRFHDLRHCCASYMAIAGVSIRTIAEILGHRTIQMSAKYSHLNIDAQRAAMDLVEEAVWRN